MQRTLRLLLEHEPPAPVAERAEPVASLWRALGALELDHSVDVAIVGGFLAASVGHAFAVGYQAALRRLVPGRLPRDELAALCVSEPGGRRGHPAHVETSLRRDEASGRLRLRGQKSFVSLGTQASRLLVLVGLESDAGEPPSTRKRLRLVEVDAAARGVELEALPPLPFVRDVSHASVYFADVELDDTAVLPGDGHTDYSRPFRTLEDAHVVSALMGRLVGLARTLDWSQARLEDALAALVGVRAAALADPDAHEIHIVLAGALRACRARLDEALDDEEAWRDAPAALRDACRRDLHGLLAVAGNARKLRGERAWHAVAERRPR